MSRRLFWRRHSPGDHLARAADLSLAQDGALLRLRDHFFTNGPLPVDPVEVAQLIRAPRSKAPLVAGLLARFFVLTPAGFIDPELQEEQDHAREVRHKRKLVGEAGARKRWEGEQKPDDDTNSQAIATDCDANAEYQLPSHTDQSRSDHSRAEQKVTPAKEEIPSTSNPGTPRARGERRRGNGRARPGGAP